jgi:hypothetical protein
MINTISSTFMHDLSWQRTSVTIHETIASDLSIQSERSLSMPNIGNAWRKQQDNRGAIDSDLSIDSDRPLSLPNTGTAIEIETIEDKGGDGCQCSRSRANNFFRYETLGIVRETIEDNQ